MKSTINDRVKSSNWKLALYDSLTFSIISILLLYVHPSMEEKIAFGDIIIVTITGLIILLITNYIFKIYMQIWRYGGLYAQIRLVVSNTIACFICIFVFKFLSKILMRAILIFSIYMFNTVVCLTSRMIYALLYKAVSNGGKISRFSKILLKIFAGLDYKFDADNREESTRKINVAIIGAGRLGVSLAQDMVSNNNSVYHPVCFVDVDNRKIGRLIQNIKVIDEKEFNKAIVDDLDIHELVFTLPNTNINKRKELVEKFKPLGCRVKVYDYPITSDISSGKLQIRAFDIEELLPRRIINLGDNDTSAYYRNKVVLVTGGGGSIGSELCRQIAAMEPKKLIICDIAENTTYDVQQELKRIYKDNLDFEVEISSVTDKSAMKKIFDTYNPQIVLHAAAHKHVPLMEHNCVEAVKNNVFGTKNVVDLCKEYKVEKFVLVSTDKAVNPTNVMGATKRLCEIIALRNTFACAVRFGNVMGSAGSVIPLFKKQIAKGGPVTITDKRIIRYFMTIYEASHLILESGSKAKSGELFVLDMGQPVKILDVAEEMIRLSGYKPYEDIEIIETGLRPGEKLYEELLMKSATLSKTDNELIFIEKDEYFSDEELESKLNILNECIKNEDDDEMRRTLKSVVPTYKSPEEVNKLF